MRHDLLLVHKLNEAELFFRPRLYDRDIYFLSFLENQTIFLKLYYFQGFNFKRQT